jgi:hypothetical protein
MQQKINLRIFPNQHGLVYGLTGFVSTYPFFKKFFESKIFSGGKISSYTSNEVCGNGGIGKVAANTSRQNSSH